MKRSRLYKAIQKEANRLHSKYLAAGVTRKADGACTDCGATEYLCHDHRDYDDVLQTDVVCYSCNYKRGPGLALVLNPDTLERVPA